MPHLHHPASSSDTPKKPTCPTASGLVQKLTTTRSRLPLGLRLLGVSLLALSASTSIAVAQEDTANPQTNTVSKPAPLPYCINIKDFGAIGDGKVDDTAAIQQAINAAGKPSATNPAALLPPTIFFPVGVYRVTNTIKITREHNLEWMFGAGHSFQENPARIAWDGARGGVLFNVAGCHPSLKISDLHLDGGDKARILMKINSVPGVGAAGFYFERLQFAKATVGLELGRDMDSCASDMTFVDVFFHHLTDCGFRTCAGQNVDYVFIRCAVGWTPIGWHFLKGGNAHFILPTFNRCRVGLKIESGGINGGVFTITGAQQEIFNYDNEKKRFPMLDVQGETNVSISGIFTGCSNCFGDEADLETPNFILGPNAQVTIRDSMISGKIARLTGSKAQVPTWLQFENCRFRCAADPRTDIDADEYSGYEFRNCHVTVDNISSKQPKRDEELLLIKHLTKVPTQVRVIDAE